jgi:hypothetical protein
MPVDEFDRPPLMTDAFARRRELEVEDEAQDAAALGYAPRRPQAPRPLPKPSGNLIAMLLVAGVFAALFAASLFGGPPPETSERPTAPAQTFGAPPTVAPAEPPAPTPAPLPTGYIVGTEPAPAQLAPVAPQAAPALAAPPVVYSDLVPLEEPTPIDPMACARRGIGACRGERP